MSFGTDCLGIASHRINPSAWSHHCLSLIQSERLALTEIWFDESEAAAEAFANAPPIGDGDGPYNLTDGYQQKAIEVARAQAAVAGARLAGLLNTALAGR
jgi:hypothetical protein